MPPRPENVEPRRLTYRLEDGLIRLSAGSPRPGSSRLREAPVAQRGRRGAGWGAELGAEGRPGVRGSEPRELAGVRERSQAAGISVGPRPRGGVMSAAGLLAPAPAPAAAPAAPEYYPEDDEELESAEDDERSCRGRESDEGAGGGSGPGCGWSEVTRALGSQGSPAQRLSFPHSGRSDARPGFLAPGFSPPNGPLGKPEWTRFKSSFGRHLPPPAL